MNDPLDNCIDSANVGQEDRDADGYGNVCDCDFNNDGSCGIADFSIFRSDFVTSSDGGTGTDMNGDGSVGIADFSLFRVGFSTSFPGPSGLAPDGDGDGQSVAGGDCADTDPSQFGNAEVVAGGHAGPWSQGVCFENRGPNGTDPRDTDGCSADQVVDVLNSLGVNPSDPEAVKDDPLAFFTAGACSAPFGTADPLNPGACELHDACLSVCGEGQSRCDLEFFSRLNETCAATYAVGTCRTACTLLADTYAAVIAAVGEQAYLNDQRIRCACCADTSACGDGTCTVATGEGVANCPADCGGFPDGDACVTSFDCASGHCSFQGECTPLVCVTGADCPSGVCNLGTCLTRPLGNGSTCSVNAACSSDVCNFGICISGGLAAASPCTTDAACRSGECLAGFCEDICGDGFCDGLEKCGNADAGFECNTDCQTCSNGQVCVNNNDCSSGVCNFAICIAGGLGNSSPCSTNVACASGVCNAGFCISGNLPAGSPCTTDAACRSGDCFGGLCEDICGDGFCDGLEKCGDANAGFECNLDCGKCQNGAVCLSNADCLSGRCLAGICAAATFCGDLSCNGGESCSSCVTDCGPCCTPNGNVCVLDAQCCSGDCRGIAPPRCG